MKRAECERIEESLVDYVDGELLPQQKEEIAEHLAGCTHCRQMAEALGRSLESAQVLWEDGFDDLERKKDAGGRLKTKTKWFAKSAVAAGLAAAACVLIGVGIWIGGQKKQQRLETIEVRLAEIEKKIEEEGRAAKLLMAADMISEIEQMRQAAREQYAYIITSYPDTKAAKKAKEKIAY